MGWIIAMKSIPFDCGKSECLYLSAFRYLVASPAAKTHKDKKCPLVNAVKTCLATKSAPIAWYIPTPNLTQ